MFLVFKFGEKNLSQFCTTQNRFKPPIPQKKRCCSYGRPGANLAPGKKKQKKHALTVGENISDSERRSKRPKFWILRRCRHVVGLSTVICQMGTLQMMGRRNQIHEDHEEKTLILVRSLEGSDSSGNMDAHGLLVYTIQRHCNNASRFVP